MVLYYIFAIFNCVRAFITFCPVNGRTFFTAVKIPSLNANKNGSKQNLKKVNWGNNCIHFLDLNEKHINI